MALSGLLLAGLILRDAPRYGWKNCAGWTGAWAVLASGALLRARIVETPVEEVAWYASATYLTVIVVTLGRPAVLVPVWAGRGRPGRDFGRFTSTERRIQSWAPWVLMAVVITLVSASG